MWPWRQALGKLLLNRVADGLFSKYFECYISGSTEHQMLGRMPVWCYFAQIICQMHAMLQRWCSFPLLNHSLLSGRFPLAKPLTQAPLRASLALQVSAILGAVINVARLPEKLFFPKGVPVSNQRRAGLFDYWLNSHQLMHILVLCSMGFKYAAMHEDYLYRMERQVQCPA